MDELTDPDPALEAAAAAAEGEPGEGVPEAKEGIGRTAAWVTFLNLISRITGFGRVLATAAALGIASLGDTYQSANLVSNILFELLAGGLLFSVLVPTFVALIDKGKREEARVLGGVLLARAGVALAVLAALGVACAPLVMRMLTTAVDDLAVRDAQVRLGAFLLWFILPQLVLYAAGAVSTALLQSDRRFTAAALAPAFNNVVVIATMVTFALVHDPDRGISLTTGEKVLLGAGTLAGTLAMTLVPWLASRRAGLSPRPRWSDPRATGLGALARKGAWGAGDIGLNQVMVLATVVFAGRVPGGVIAYQTAFTFFLLPHALLAHPVFTTMFPRMSAHGQSGDLDGYAADVTEGIRVIGMLLAPAAGLIAVIALPLLDTVRIGQLDQRGSALVASVLAAYMVGSLGYSGFFLLTRASYAIDDVKSPTMVYLWTTLAAIAGMAAVSNLASGDGRVALLGIVHGVAVTVGTVGLLAKLRRRIHRPVPVIGALARAVGGALVASGLAWVASQAIGWSTRGEAIASMAVATIVTVVVYLAVLWVTRSPELRQLVTSVKARRGPRGAVA